MLPGDPAGKSMILSLFIKFLKVCFGLIAKELQGISQTYKKG